MSDGVTTWDLPTFLAYSAIVAEQLGQPNPPVHLALPGAKVAIPRDRLHAQQDAGRGEREIVTRVNARWERDNATRLETHARWTQGPYIQAIEQAREAKAQESARNLRRLAALERLAEERLKAEGA